VPPAEEFHAPRSVPVSPSETLRERPWRAEGIGHILNFELLKLWLVLASVRRTVQSAVRATLVASLRRERLW